jgi:enoyl-CoA hydratase
VILREVAMDYETIRLEKEERVSIVTLNRPESLNAINMTMFEEIGKVVSELRADPETRAIVLTGAGRAFSSGLDVLSFQGLINQPTMQFREMLEELQRVYNSLETIEKPVIAAIKGPCIGGALELALACDIRIAARGSSFGMLEMRYAIIPDLGGCKKLARLVGLGHAKELIFTADIIDDERAREIGLVEHLVEEEGLMEKTMELARKLSQGPILTIGLAKRVINRSWDLDTETSLLLDSLAQTICVNSKDFQEAVKAFLERRKPDYKGE